MPLEKSVLIPIGEVLELHHLAYFLAVGLNVFLHILVFRLELLINTKLFGRFYKIPVGWKSKLLSGGVDRCYCKAPYGVSVFIL